MHKPSNRRCSCGAIVPSGKRCPTCSKTDGTSLYNSYRWQQLRKWHKRREPLCVECERRGVIRRAEQVDHITPHRGNEQLFFDPGNLQSLCTTCHRAKTTRDNT